MAELKATPGPWKVFRTTDGRTLLGVGDRNAGGITDCGDVSTNDQGLWRSGKEREANAHLIAAAPELYEALVTARIALIAVADSALDAGFDQLADIIDEQLGKANAALAKARGEQSPHPTNRSPSGQGGM